MYDEVLNSDFILPLLDKNIVEHERYITQGTSGSFQLSYGFAKPSVIQKCFAEKYALNDENAIIYNENEEFSSKLLQAITISDSEYQNICKNLKGTSLIIQEKSLNNLKLLLNVIKPQVSIIIPVYNNFQLTKNCIDSISAANLKTTYEIILADDGSTDETPNIEKYYNQVRLIKTSCNVGFLLNVKNAVKYANGDYIFLMNNDMIAKQGFLDYLYQTITNMKNIGVVGAMTLNIDNTIQEIGGTVYSDAHTEWNYTNRKNININHLYNVDYCSGCGIMFAKTDWDKLGGFDEKFIPAYYEDVDLCYQIKYNLGKKIVCQPKAQIYHLCGNTYKESAFTLMKQNRLKFYQKWQTELTKAKKSKNNKLKKVLKFVLAIENSENRKHKVITLLGLKLKIKRKASRKAKKEYYEFLENKNILENNSFVAISKEKYNGKNTVKPIAFYLPQFHAIELNDKNFVKGFTEWTNVTKAIPQFVGHHQPQIPIDVGFYDLSTDNVMYRQIELAKQYGIYGFCFHYYWFSGKRLLEKPIFNYLNNKELDLPFCLCWANENWSKLWDGGNKELLMEQKLQNDDDEKFFYDILPFFKDERYIKIDNKPVLIIYRINLFEEERVKTFIKNIKQLAKKEGFDGIYLLGASVFNCENPLLYGADAVVEFPPHKIAEYLKLANLDYVNKNFVGAVFDMASYVNDKLYINKQDGQLYKTVFPAWDNTARKAQTNAHTYLCEPNLYKEWLKNIINWTKQNHKENEQFVFINAWNEWAEGAHLEPDTKYGYAYLQATKDALEETI